MTLSNVKTKLRAFASWICSEFNQIELYWNRIVHQNTLWSLVFSTTRPWNKQISAPDASQPSSQERWQVADLKHLKTSYIFSLPRISTKDFPYIKGKIDRSTGINYSSVNFKWAKSFFVASRLIAEVNANQPTRVAMIWLRVKVNRTRLCTAVHFARNEIIYQKSRENGLFQYKLYACTIACLSFICTYIAL